MALPTFEKPDFSFTRMYLLVWGASGCGKTTLAATAPGAKAIIQFDPQGATSIANRDDFYLLDISGSSFTMTMMEFQKADPFGMRAFITAHPDVETVVIDSITTLSFQALQYAVTKAGGNSNIEVPGMNGYGTRNNVMRRAVQVIMQICSELKKHLIVITHEAAPDKDTQGNTIEVTMSLSSSLANDVSLRFNEVWHMKDIGMERVIYVRPAGVWKPMKSRMFQSQKDAKFVWHYNADALHGEGISDWFHQWQNNGGAKIPLPTKK
jgi:hypothetical protein